MSLVASRANLTHAATIERDSNAGTLNAAGAPNSPSWGMHLSALACRAWTTVGRETLDATTSVVIEDMRLIVPLGTDVNEQDRVTAVIDREGNPVITGTVGIRAVIHRRDHLELILVRVS